MPSQTSAVPSIIRSAALLEVAGELGLRAGSARGARRRSALLGLHCLAAFAAKQLRLFDQGFTNGALAHDDQFPPAFILEATERQVAFDIDLFLRTIGQREAENSTAAMRDTLALADRLAANALAPAVRHQLIEETAILTYFQKTSTVRLLPYAPLALIGIDLTAINDTARLAAIAHEAGHHVYRQMTVNYLAGVDEQVAQRMASPAEDDANALPAWLLPWVEEIFADVYSVLVAGPVAGLSVQAMLMAESPLLLLLDDADHPLPALRPWIAVAVLQKLAALDANVAARLQLSATRLDEQWRTYLLEQKIGAEFTPAGGGKPVTLAAARQQVAAYVDALLESELASLAHAPKSGRWSKGLADSKTPLAELYAQFAAFCVDLTDDEIPELAAAGDKKVAVTPQVHGVKGGQRIVGQIGDPYLDQLRDDALAGKRTLSAGAWKAVFLAGDWVTEEGGSGITPVR